MKRDAGACLSAVFVDYDNIYLSLRRKSEEAAKRFAKDAGVWMREIESGGLITATNNPLSDLKRRIVLNRCYGNPVPRRNPGDNSTDMNSFPFVRHHFLRAGFEVIDCPPLTAQLKNSSDIRMVMDVRDSLMHETYFDEFVILSGDADFTPLLHRLRAHARRTIIFANDFTAAPYTAISDGEIREADLIALLLEGRLPARDGSAPASVTTESVKAEQIRAEIMAEVVAGVQGAAAPVPLETLADRAVKALGHDKTIATAWAGAGSFRELLRQHLPDDVRLSDGPPYLAFDPRRHTVKQSTPAGLEPSADPFELTGPMLSAPPIPSPLQQASPPQPPPPLAARPAPSAASRQRAAPTEGPAMSGPRQAAQPASAPSARSEAPSAIQQSIARIQEACQAPPLAPHEYRLLFEIIAKEINDVGLNGAQTLANITQRARERGLDVRKDDVRFVLEVVSEADPWFEQGASANLFAGRFRNFVVARCRGQGLDLSADELDLIDAWFAGGALPQGPTAAAGADHAQQAGATQEGRVARWWALGESRSNASEQRPPMQTGPDQPALPGDDFPRIVRSRLRG
jgi:hypothetical protein